MSSTAKSKAKVHLELLEEDKTTAGTRTCKLLLEGIKIEEAQ
jgi:hypothetical protein